MASSTPAVIRLNPLRAIGRGRGQWQIEDRQRLPRASAPANRDYLLIAVEINALDCDQDAEDHCIERHRQVLFDYREPTRDLLKLAVSVDGGLLDHLSEPRRGEAQNGLAPALVLHSAHVNS